MPRQAINYRRLLSTIGEALHTHGIEPGTPAYSAMNELWRALVEQPDERRAEYTPEQWEEARLGKYFDTCRKLQGEDLTKLVAVRDVHMRIYNLAAFQKNTELAYATRLKLVEMGCLQLDKNPAYIRVLKSPEQVAKESREALQRFAGIIR